MNTPSAAVDPHNSKSVLPDNTPKPVFGVRIADIAALNAQGQTIIGQRRIPTLGAFDQPFAAFAQGTIFQADKGFIAVEDIQPGDWLMTAQGTPEQVTWVGSATFAPTDPGDRMHLTRVMADSFGINRPENFVSLGSAARVLQAAPNCRGSAEAERMMTPANRFLDGVNVIEFMPPTPVRLFHIGLRRHSAMIASGLAVESFHPGAHPLRDLSSTLGDVFVSLFPHVDKLGDLGPMTYSRAPEV
ncbi:MAG: Hint domain-containing protein [Roseobacter sp.]|jgi:hypothetical protein|nr:Hint domain-containing protein [Roseobacter sp.]